MAELTIIQIVTLLSQLRQSGISRNSFQRLLDNGCFTDLLSEFKDEPAHPEPTIMPLEFAGKYSEFRRQYKTLVQARDAMRLGIHDAQDVNDQNFPPEERDEDREFVLVCFNRDIDDNEDPAKSELLRELDKLGLEPEGPMELCFVGADERTRALQREYPIVARRQVWQGPGGYLFCPILRGSDDRRSLDLDGVRGRWRAHCRFLASRKPAKPVVKVTKRPIVKVTKRNK